MYRILLVLCLFLPLFAAGCAAKRPPAAGPFPPGAFVSPEGALLDQAALARTLAGADYVLVGETHDSPVDHKAQAALLAVMAGAGLSPAVGLEMLPRDRFDKALSRFSAGEIPLGELSQALDWQQSWGYDFTLYSPVFEAAARHRLPLYGLNIANDARKAVSRKGLEGLNSTESRQLPLAIIPPLPAQRAELAALFSAHSAMIGRAQSRPGSPAAGAKTEITALQPAGMVGKETGKEAGKEVGKEAGGRPTGSPAASPDGSPAAFMAADSSRLERFLLIQSIWDSVMAERAAKLRRENGGPVVVLAGSGHVAQGYGIAHRLRFYDPAARMLTVVPFSGASPEGGGDVYFYSPERKRFGLRFEDGLGAPLIASVTPGSLADKAGLKAGDRVVGAAGETLASARDLHRVAVEAKDRGTALELAVEREGKKLRMRLE